MKDLQYSTLSNETNVVDAATVEAFALAFRGELVFTHDAGYEEVRALWNGMIDLHPALIARCSDAADVATAVNFAREHNMLISVRGAGHNIAGKASCDGGLMIDLSSLTAIKVDEQNKTAIVGPGATLGHVDKATQAFGLAVPVGINSTTGIAGLTLGGGFGWLTRKYGLTVDNLISAEVVTADGNIVKASADENNDLFWGLQGGGGNFGIVTSFEFNLVEVGPDVHSGLVVYSLSEAKSVLTKYREFVAQAPEELSVWCVLRKAPPLPFLPEEVHGQEVVILPMVYSGDMAEGEALTKPLTEFGTPLGHALTPHKFADFQQAFDPLLEPGARNYWKSHDFTELSDEAIDLFIEYAGNLPTAQCEIFVAHIAGAMNRVASDATAYVQRNTQFVLNVHGRWDDASEDATCISWAREFFDKTSPHASGSVYVNFMTEDEQDRVQAAYGVNYERLVALKQKYDAGNMFRINQNIKP
jgi:FAD/FMN-containing dehydrogenase